MDLGTQKLLGTFLFACLVLGWTPANAVILGGVDGSGNITAPADDPGWNRVGTVNGDSGVYLGDGFVLSAKHVGAGDLTLGGTTYALDPSYVPQFFQTQSSPQEFADLVIFKVENAPVMSLMPIWNGSGEVGKTATLIGTGVDRGAAVAGQGWLWGTTHTKRWGQNVIDGTVPVNDPSINVSYQALFAAFNRVGGGGSGLANEATGAFGDSGGGLFIKQGSTWELAGIITAVTANGHSYYDNNTSVPGDQPDFVYAARLSDYNNWILTTIPEPDSLVLMLLAGGLLGATLLRRKRP